MVTHTHSAHLSHWDEIHWDGWISLIVVVALVVVAVSTVATMVSMPFELTLLGDPNIAP